MNFFQFCIINDMTIRFDDTMIDFLECNTGTMVNILLKTLVSIIILDRKVKFKPRYHRGS